MVIQFARSVRRSWRRIGETFGGRKSGGIALQEAIGVSQFQDTLNHTGGAGEAKRTSGSLQTRETIHDFSQARAIEFGEVREVEYDASVLLPEKFIHGQLELLALDAHLKLAG